jgi:hypothetical protein
MANNYYVDPGYWDDGYVVTYLEADVPDWAVLPVSDLSTVPAYLYQEYYPDPDNQAFFDSYNTSAEAYFDYLNSLYLPVWTSPNVVGPLLDWVASELYGVNRPVFTVGGATMSLGVYDSNVYNFLPYNSAIIAGGSTLQYVNDDILKRILTWNLYKGDGNQFNARWLKNRVMRFLYGVNGVAPQIDNTYNVSVQFNANNNIVIHILSFYDPTIPPILESAVQSQVLNLPFQYNFSVTY